jgi:ABC-2 type transport system permease protein
VSPTTANLAWVRPSAILARATLLQNLRSLRVWALVALASLPTVLILGIAAYGPSAADLVTDYENATATFLPLVLLIVTLLIAVPLMRDEIDGQTISYLITRTIGKPRIILGKYAGAVATGILVVLLPTLVGYAGVAAAVSGTGVSLTGILPSVVAMVVLGVAAYSAFFLFIGLLFRRALIIGLLYTFFWEEFVWSLGGESPELTVRYYLLSIPAHWVALGPLSNLSPAASLPEALAVPLLFAAALLVVAWIAFRFLSLVPAGQS